MVNEEKKYFHHARPRRPLQFSSDKTNQDPYFYSIVNGIGIDMPFLRASEGGIPTALLWH